MKKVIGWIMWAVTAIVVYKSGLWSYDFYTARSRAATEQEIVDIDKQCILDADTGRCICRHKRTGQRLKLPYDECKSRAMNSR